MCRISGSMRTQGRPNGLSQGSPYFWYSSGDSPEDLIRKYKIRFNEESHVIEAHGHKGDFTIRKYGDGERAGTMDGVFYSGNETASGEAEVRDQVPTMTGWAQRWMENTPPCWYPGVSLCPQSLQSPRAAAQISIIQPTPRRTLKTGITARGCALKAGRGDRGKHYPRWRYF